MNRFVFPMLAAACLASGAACADPTYHKQGLVGFGYTDSVIGPDQWRVTGSAHEYGGSLAVAFYRAAELAQAAHADRIRVVRQRIVSTFSRYGGSVANPERETASLTVRAVRSDADLAVCEMKRADQCMTLEVARIMTRYSPYGGRPDRLANAALEPGAPPLTTPKRVLVAPAAPPRNPYDAGRQAALAALARTDGRD
jgi:hypothetical protein